MPKNAGMPRLQAGREEGRQYNEFPQSLVSQLALSERRPRKSSLARSRTAVTAFRGEIRKKRWREEGGRESHGEAT